MTFFFLQIRAVSTITSTVFFPIFPWIFQIAVIGAAIVIGLYLASVGEAVNQVIRMNQDGNCRCSGPANAYHDGSICDPHIFNQYCSESSGFFGSKQISSCKVAKCVFKEIKSPAFMTYLQVSC